MLSVIVPIITKSLSRITRERAGRMGISNDKILGIQNSHGRKTLEKHGI